VGLRGIDRLESNRRSGWALLAASAALISCAGMVKVIGFLALGFTGMALARHLRTRPQGQRSGPRAIVTSAALHATMLVATA
ncbi:polyprenol phosphomannose-dependent alpha 1,6 mannosyltransferase MptB, partial [Salmonella enterica]|uniref:polyprenol phosphomannose-dependent alpha 1,6 mannosyltransferase MptB n=1 Tax=Salmonella enterica TaxID=28901 RepID=UPI001E5F9130